MKKIINKYTIFAFILGAIIFSSVSVYAYLVAASNVSYTPSNTSWNVSNVNSALNSLYTMAQNKISSGTITNVSVSTEYTINTGLTQIHHFYALQYNGSTNMIAFADYDSAYPSYQVRGGRKTGAGTTGCNTANIGASSGNMNTSIISVSGGTVVYKTGSNNTAADALDIHWCAD